MAKRRPSGDGMVRKREDGRWEGRIVVGHKDNGDSIFRYVYADTQKELTARLRKCITAYQGVDLTEQSRLTLSEWLDQWLVSKEGMVRPGTLNGYCGYIENHIRPCLGEKRISQIKAVDIQRFYDMLSRKLASGTVRRIHTTLHGILKAAAQARLIPRNPVEEVTPPKFSYQKKNVLTEEQIDRFMEVIQEDTLWHDLFYTELTTGLRRGELCGLRWEDFDAANGTLKICRTVRREKGKGLKSYWTNKHLEWLSSLDLGNKILSEVLQEYLIRYYQLREQVDMYDMRINELAQAEPYRQKVEKLGCFRGIAAHTALSFCVEVGDFRRFATAQQFASYLGLVPGECSSGDKQQYTGITKAGNSHLRKLLVETAQVFGRSATKSGKSVALKERQAKCDSLTVAYADKANARLKKKYFKIAMRSKVNIAKTAVAREMACFIWGMMTDNISCA